VVGAIDGNGLEKPVAFVIARRGVPVGEDELAAFCRDGLPSYARPKRFLLVDAFPATATGKVRRVELREMAAGLLAAPEAATAS
jgi:acyl-coenzyme A synthetase/AMP-(fatty) acid ligase